MNDDLSVSVAVRLSLLEDKVDRLLAVHAEQDVRQRVMEQQIARMSVLVGFVSAGISGIVTWGVSLMRAR